MTNENLNTVIKNAKEALKYPELYQNVSASERWLSGAAGTFLFVKGIQALFSHPVIGLTSAVAGAGLLYRGITGYCPMKDYAEQEVANAPDEVVITETYVVDDLA
ncbi:YgaP family membrane protein [Pedobacter sp.]|uniref:YgaP family membrane protein n=1 Tax=Pedobacter sp. TaxID=1411316 RepID=UPI003BA99843